MSSYEILCYTREPMEDAIYACKLADSMHIALVNGDEITELNHNSGVLFAKAYWQEDKVMCAKSLKNPWLFELKDGGYGVIAERIEADGGEDEASKGCVLFYRTEDMMQYTSDVLIKLSDDYINDAVCEYDKNEDVYIIRWCDNNGGYYSAKIDDISSCICTGEQDVADNCQATKTDRSDDTSDCSDNVGSCHGARQCGADDKPECHAGMYIYSVAVNAPVITTAARDISKVEPFDINTFKADGEYSITGIKPRNKVTIDDKLAHRLICKLTVPRNVKIEVTDSITVSSRKELDDTKVKLLYSDGTDREAYVRWYADDIDFGKPGKYKIDGLVKQNHYEFPIAFNRADPCIGKWNGKYYFIATNDADHEHTLYIREADSIPELVTAEEVLILDSVTYPHIGNLLWAPEFHIVKDRLYIFHAATPQDFGDEQSHVMALRPGGNPMKKSDWEEPRRVVKKDGSPLFTTGITLDMTCFEVDGHYYVCWSQREFVPKDLGAWLYISEVDPDEPWRLIADPVLLSAPEFGWANNHTFVDEGPFALIKNDKVFLTFSSAAVDSTYVVGLLTADINSDLLNVSSWTKTNYPLLTSRSVEGQYGTGHNAYVEDDNGEYWNTYHGRPGVNAPRSSGIRRVHFDIDGYPMLDMTEECDLAPELKNICTELSIETTPNM